MVGGAKPIGSEIERVGLVSRLTELILKAKAADSDLGAELEREIKVLASRRAFGLNFERHQPESVELPRRPVRRGDKVRIKPPRASTGRADEALFRVKRIHRTDGGRTAEVEPLGGGATLAVSVDDLVVVAEFRDPIFPGLLETGRVERGGDKPFHTVINGENFHALQTLSYTHRGRIDVVYIDPPYNTGARDWKYNNDYVEGDDLYRHSKWLAFMERRLLLARKLLNPDNSVLIVTIDEKEYLRLGLLLEQLFPGAVIQMVTVVIKPEGTGRVNEFSRTNEFLYFVMNGSVAISPQVDNMYDRDGSEGGQVVEWRDLRRRERTSRRRSRPNQFYAVFVDERSGRIHSVGDPLPDEVDRESVQVPEGCRPVFPLNPRGEEFIWGTVPSSLRELVDKGYAKAEGRTIRFLQSGTISAIERGDVIVSGYEDQGGVIAEYSAAKPLMPKTVWTRESHNSQASGTILLKRCIPGRDFPFPKSLYAVEDALRFFVAEKPEATILDFFAGSGTTAHAVMRLNRQDGGRRQCISVTNNEVSAEEHRALRRQGLRPGDPEWEAHGICEHITKPRIEAAITGRTPEGEPIRGGYKFTDEFPMSEGFEENAAFFTLTYEAPVPVGHNRSFEKIAALLWMRAGSEGRRIDRVPEAGWDVADTYGILFDLDQAAAFEKAVKAADGLRLVYVVTDDQRRFQSVANRLPTALETVRLYESYLTNFRFTSGDAHA